MSLEHRRLTYALLLSLLIHAWLLSLIFGGQGLWLPSFGFPWQVRRIEAPDLRVVVVPPQVAAAEPLPQVPVEQPVASAPVPTPSVSRAPTPRPTVAAIIPKANPTPDAATGAAPAQTPLRGDSPGDTALPPIPPPAVIAVAPTDEATWAVPATPAMPPPPVIAPLPSVSIPETAMPSLRDAGEAARARIAQDAGERAVEPAKPDSSKQEAQRQAEQLEAARQEATRQEATRQEAARQEAAQQEAARQEATRQEATRQEATRQEATRQEAARQEATRQEAARQEATREEATRQEATRQEATRQEAARQEAARQEAARQEAARQEAARQEAARQEAARQEAARQEAARLEAARVAQEADARREEARRAMGRTLDEEAARRDAAAAAARPSSSLPLSLSTARRYRLFGRSDPNGEVIQYAENWARKIHVNMTFDMVREAAKQPHADPLVTVAVRSDGSVESVTFVQSSGVPALDDAIRRVVQSQAPYQAFPPALAREYDVIEIRRTWYFDVAIRLY